MKPTSIQTEIISLLHSPELQAYLLASPELLQTTDYAELIAGAPIGLSKKLELLEKLEESLADSEDAELVHIYVECVEDAMEPLEKPYEQLFCAQFYAANGMFPRRSFRSNAKKITRRGIYSIGR